MIKNLTTNVEYIIAKIDNDFNPDNSDWIPRVPTWCIEAMNILNVFNTKQIQKKLTVKDRIAYSECNINNCELKVYDENGCEIEKAKVKCCCGNVPSTGKITQSNSTETTDTTGTRDIYYNSQAKGSTYVKADTINTKEWPGRYNVVGYRNDYPCDKNYVIIDCNKIELNFDTDFITIVYTGIESYYSDNFNCDLPVIPNNGLLIEAITYYCMYKMLCRGYKHPVFNLKASMYGTNPFERWNNIKDEAKRSVINNKNIEDFGAWRNSFFNFTFNPKDK